jgi:hypothetical protein
MLGIFLITMTTSMTKECTCDISNNDDDSKDRVICRSVPGFVVAITILECPNQRYSVSLVLSLSLLFM